MRTGALRHPVFRRYLAAQSVSLVGTWMQGAAQAWLVLELTGSAARLGTVSAVQTLPVLLFSLVAGTIADHARRRRVLATTQLSLAICAATLGLLTVTGRVRYWHVVGIAAVYGFFNTLDMPARHAFLGDMVPRDALASAIGLHSSVFNLARIVGPGVAGLVVAAVGSAPAFLLNALSFLPIVGVLLTTRVEQDRRGGSGPSLTGLLRPDRLWKPLSEGLAYVGRVAPIRRSLVLLGIVSLFSMNFNVLVPVYAQQVLGQGATGYGFLMSSLGVGALAGALALAASASTEPSPLFRSAGVVGLGAGLIGLSLTRSYALSAILLALTGWGMVSLSVGTNALVQLSSDAGMRGRVMSTFSWVLVGVTPVGSLVAGTVADQFGVATALALGGAVAIGAWAWMRPWEIRVARPAEYGVLDENSTSG